MKRTVIVGATTNPGRYAFLAAQMLNEYGHSIIPIGIKKGELFGTEIRDIFKKPAIENVDTITLYIGPHHQPEWYEYLIGLKPKRIIFNPGTENGVFQQLAENQGIEALEACTLVMLRTNQF
jgi:hypothetical protein